MQRDDDGDDDGDAYTALGPGEEAVSRWAHPQPSPLECSWAGRSGAVAVTVGGPGGAGLGACA